MHTNLILNNKRCTHAQSNCTNTKLKAWFMRLLRHRPGNVVGLFYSHGPIRERGGQQSRPAEQQTRASLTADQTLQHITALWHVNCCISVRQGTRTNKHNHMNQPSATNMRGISRWFAATSNAVFRFSKGFSCKQKHIKQNSTQLHLASLQHVSQLYAQVYHHRGDLPAQTIYHIFSH